MSQGAFGASGSFAAAASPVDQATEFPEKLRYRLDFVQDHQLVFMPGEIVNGVGQPLTV